MRSRNIKPGFFDNEVLAEGGPCVQILFSGLWCLADREGRLEDRPVRIKVKIFPYYEPFIGLTVGPPLSNGGPTVIERLIQILSEREFIKRYEVEGKRYIQILNFPKHQSPHNTEKASIIPKIPDSYNFNGGSTVNPPLSNGGSRPDSLIPDSLIPDSLIPDLGLSKDKPQPSAESPDSDRPWKEPPKNQPKKPKLHFSKKVGEQFEAIKAECDALLKLPHKNGKPFNPYMFVQKAVNNNGHPEAIYATLRHMHGGWDGIDTPVGWWNSVFNKYNGTFNEQDHTKQTQVFKKYIDSPKIKKLIQGIGGE